MLHSARAALHSRGLLGHTTAGRAETAAHTTAVHSALLMASSASPSAGSTDVLAVCWKAGTLGCAFLDGTVLRFCEAADAVGIQPGRHRTAHPATPAWASPTRAGWPSSHVTTELQAERLGPALSPSAGCSPLAREANSSAFLSEHTNARPNPPRTRRLSEMSSSAADVVLATTETLADAQPASAAAPVAEHRVAAVAVELDGDGLLDAPVRPRYHPRRRRHPARRRRSRAHPPI